MTHCANEGNALEAEQNGMDVALFPQNEAAGLVTGARDAGWFNPERGATLQDALHYFRDSLKLISGWARCSTFDDCMAALARGNPVYTASAAANWAASSKGTFVRADKSYGHAFIFDGYERGETTETDALWLRNSGGVSWGLQGRCKLLRPDFMAMQSCYEVYDLSNSEIVSAYRKKMEDKTIAALVAAGVTNGQRPNDPVTRRETWLMLARMADPKVLAAVQTGLK
jgi:hypothetical protein